MPTWTDADVDAMVEDLRGVPGVVLCDRVNPLALFDVQIRVVFVKEVVGRSDYFHSILSRHRAELADGLSAGIRADWQVDVCATRADAASLLLEVV